MKIIVNEQVYWQLQEALKDELTPNMVNAIKKMHPNESELILNSDHIPATDKIPNINKKFNSDYFNYNRAPSNDKGALFGFILAIGEKIEPILKLCYAYNLIRWFLTNSLLIDIEWMEVLDDLFEETDNHNVEKVERFFNYDEFIILNFKKTTDGYDGVVSGRVKFNKFAPKLLKIIGNFLEIIPYSNNFEDYLIPQYRYIKDEYDKAIANKSIIDNAINFITTMFKIGIPNNISLIQKFYFSQNNLPQDFLKRYGVNPRYLLYKFHGLSYQGDLRLVITDNPKLKFSMGKSDFFHSCMNYLFYRKQYPFPVHLLSNLYDENSKVALILNDNGENVARCVLRYFPKQQSVSDRPLIFIDKYYGDGNIEGDFINELKTILAQRNIHITMDKNEIKEYVFDVKKMLDRIGLKNLGSIKTPYLDFNPPVLYDLSDYE